MRERSPGHWQLRAFAGNDPLTGRPRQVSRTFVGGERAAGKALAALVAEAESGRVVRTSATVGQLLDAWLQAGERTQRPRTLYENRRKIESRIRPTLGSVRLDKLRADTLDTAYGRWLDDGLSPATVRKYHAILSAACRQAVKWGWIDRSPTERTTPPSVVRREMLVPTPERLSELVSAAEKDDPVLATAIAIAALTGMRRGELVALRWSDVTFTGASIRVSRSITVARGEHHTGPTKTHQARDIALDELGVDVLERHSQFTTDLALEAESPLVQDPYVLSYNANGALPVNPDTLTHRFGALCEAMEGPALKKLRRTKPKAKRTDLALGDRWPYRFHDLRHFSVTTLIAAGVDVRTVAARHGHARATMTLDLYAHALPERDRHAAAVLGSQLARVQPSG